MVEGSDWNLSTNIRLLIVGRHKVRRDAGYKGPQASQAGADNSKIAFNISPDCNGYIVPCSSSRKGISISDGAKRAVCPDSATYKKDLWILKIRADFSSVEC